MSKLVSISIIQDDFKLPTPEVLQEQNLAIYDLEQNNFFQLVGFEAHDEIKLNISLSGNSLAFQLRSKTDEMLKTFFLSLTPLKQIINDYYTICESYFNAVKNLPIDKIESIDTNADLDLRTSGTGSVTLENFTASGDTITNTSGDFIINPASSVFKVAGTGSIRIPSGNTAQRPASPVAGMMRYNTQTNVFEGYNGSNWIALTGVYDLDQDTYITAELTPGNDDDTIRFYAANTLVANVNSSRFDVTKLVVDNIEISGNTLTTTGVDQDLILNANGNGSIRIEDFRFQGNTITNIISAPLKLKTTGTGYIDVSDAGGFVIPVGTTVDRPVTGLLGMIRYNTNDERVELYDGVQWGSIAGSSGAVSIIDATEIAVQMAVTLG